MLRARRVIPPPSRKNDHGHRRREEKGLACITEIDITSTEHETFKREKIAKVFFFKRLGGEHIFAQHAQLRTIPAA